jgi:hypothetical protein
MKNVYLASVGARSGKSVVSLGFAMNYPGKVGFYKPFRESLINVNGEVMDQDAFLMAEVLKLEEGKRLSPFFYDIFNPVGMNDIVSGYDELCKGKEFMIIEGSREFANGCTHKLSHVDIAEALNAPLVLMATTNYLSVDFTFMFKDLCDQRGVELRGVVLNRCVKSPERKLLEKRGIKVLGEVPEMPELRTFRVSEISDRMDAKVIAGEKGMGNIVENMLVGAMSTQTAVRYMRRSKRKAVITGGDRAEIQLAALSTDTSCMIVTGGLRPSRMVLSRADELGVPVLMTNEDTLHVTEAIEHLIARIDPSDKEKIEIVRKTVRRNVDLDEVWR